MSGYTTRFVAAILVSFFFFSCTVKASRRKISSSHLAKIHDIRIAEGLNKTIIEIEADEPLLYTSFRLSNPDRLVIEMAEVSLGQYDKEIKIAEGPIRAIHPSPSGELDVTRLEFELSGPVETEIHPDGLSIVVEVTRPKESPKKSFAFFEDEQRKFPSSEEGDRFAKIPVVKPTTPPLLVPPGAMGEKKAKEAKIEKKPVARKKAPPLAPAKNVLSVRFEQTGSLRLVVRSDGKLSPRIFYSDRTKKHLIVDFPGVKSKRGYEQISGDGQLVKRVRFGRHPDKLRLVLDFNQAIIHSSEQIQKELKITIKKGRRE